MVFGEDERILSSRNINKQNNPNKKIIFRKYSALEKPETKRNLYMRSL
jgi:hypothetical protein